MKGELRIGCSGWSYDSWVGSFYPKGTEPRRFLELYSRVYDTVEINSTFYHTPNPRVVASWFRRTPADFTFTTKMLREVNHDARLSLPQASAPLRDSTDRSVDYETNSAAYSSSFHPPSPPISLS